MFRRTGIPFLGVSVLIVALAGSVGVGPFECLAEEETPALKGLAHSAQQAGDVEQSPSPNGELTDKDSKDLASQLALFETASRKGDQEAMEQQLRKIREIEGEGPYYHYATALLLASKLRQTPGKPLNRESAIEALKHVAEAHKGRPDWPLPLVLAATIYDTSGDRAHAIQYFTEAVKLGDRQPAVVHRLAVLLFQEQRFDEADRTISLFDEATIKASEDLTRLWTEIKLLRRDYDKALELAEYCKKGSNDYSGSVWLGRVYAVLAEQAKNEGDTAKMEKLAADAERLLTKAVQMRQPEPAAWVTLVQLFSVTGKRQKAQQMIEQAKSRIDPARRSAALTRMYELSGDTASAATAVMNELKAKPDDPAVLKRAADLCIRNKKLDEAAELLERMIAGKKMPGEDVAWARQRLSLILFERGGYQNYQRALQIIDANVKANPDSLFDLRIKARILAACATREQRKDAIAILERILKTDAQETPEDRFVLARLYLAEGDWPKGSRQMRQVVQLAGANPKYLEVFIRDLIQHGEEEEAATWVGRLEKAAPDAFSTSDVKAQVLAQQGKAQDAINVLQGFVERTGVQPPDKNDRLLLVAKALERMARRPALKNDKATISAFSRAAEVAYRRYAENRPEGKLLLGTFLAEEGRIDDAVDILETAWRGAKSDELGAAAVSMISRTGATKSQLAQVEKVVDDALADRKNPASLLLAKAELCVIAGRDDEAEKTYRAVVKQNPRNVVALNNLAVFLANRGTQLEEALRLVNRCIEAAGPVGPLLDSRGCVYLAQENWDEAIADFEDAVADAPSPTRYFHLAEARYGAQDADGAKDALERARELGLTNRDLQKAEIPRYESLLKALDMQPKGE